MYGLELWQIVVFWLVCSVSAFGLAVIVFQLDSDDSARKQKFKLSMWVVSVIGGPISLAFYLTGAILLIIAVVLGSVIEPIADSLEAYRSKSKR
jgi:lipid-A-disaccharide synthase-like uncharacterized protein